jgi:hypothetical protein
MMCISYLLSRMIFLLHSTAPLPPAPPPSTMDILKRPLRAVIQLCFLQQLGCSAAVTAAACDDDGYTMYVWTRGFDPNAANCNGVYPINATGDNATCFHHNWDTPAAQLKLWSSCFNPEREITRLFLSDAKHRIENDGRDALGNCDPDLIVAFDGIVMEEGQNIRNNNVHHP